MHPLIIHSTYTLYIEKFNYIKFKPKQNPKPERFFKKDKNTQDKISSKTNLKRNLSKMTFQKGSSSERQTLSEKLKLTGRSRSKEDSNQTRRDRSSTSINQDTETENNKSLGLTVTQLEKELPLFKQKVNKGETENISFKRH